MNSKSRVQSKRRYESHESCVCIVGFPACGINYTSALVHFRLPQVTFLDCEINDIKLTEPEVKEIINNLNTKKSTGPDLI